MMATVPSPSFAEKPAANSTTFGKSCPGVHTGAVMAGGPLA